MARLACFQMCSLLILLYTVGLVHYVRVVSVRTDRPVVGRRIHVGAVKVGHSVVVGVGIPCRSGQAHGPTRHWQRHGMVGAGQRDTFSCEKKETTKQ